MEFLRRAQQEEIAPRRGPPKEDHDGRDGEHFWRRLALRALLALSAARLQVVLCEVVEIEPAYSFYHEAPRAKGTDGLPGTVSRAAIFMRPQLTDSKSSKCCASSSECRHPTLKHWGNASARWWTCIAFGARWSRPDGETNAV